MAMHVHARPLKHLIFSVRGVILRSYAVSYSHISLQNQRKRKSDHVIVIAT